MTKATFYVCGGALTGFCIDGHTADYDTEEGRLVCSAVSSAAYMAANTVTEVIGAAADAFDSDGHMTLNVGSSDGRTQAVLEGLRLHLRGLEEQYPHYIKVNLEVQPNA